jgi:hypothetical protein
MARYYADTPSPDELYHYGVKGMKWGKHKKKAQYLLENTKDRLGASSAKAVNGLYYDRDTNRFESDTQWSGKKGHGFRYALRYSTGEYVPDKKTGVKRATGHTKMNEVQKNVKQSTKKKMKKYNKNGTGGANMSTVPVGKKTTYSTGANGKTTVNEQYI